MLFRRTSIAFFLFLAFVMLQAHNLMPHHHIEFVGHTHEQRHHHDHDDDHDSEHLHHDTGTENGHDNDFPFNDLNHTADFGQTVAVPKDMQLTVWPLLLVECFISHFIILSGLTESPEPIYSPPDNISHSSLVLFSALPRRAPPAFAATM
jgi:hypothetical protein